MSRFFMLMTGSWAAAVVVIAFFALWESGKLAFVRTRIALWFGAFPERQELKDLELESGSLASED